MRGRQVQSKVILLACWVSGHSISITQNANSQICFSLMSVREGVELAALPGTFGFWNSDLHYGIRNSSFWTFPFSCIRKPLICRNRVCEGNPNEASSSKDTDLKTTPSPWLCFIITQSLEIANNTEVITEAHLTPFPWLLDQCSCYLASITLVNEWL